MKTQRYNDKKNMEFQGINPESSNILINFYTNMVYEKLVC